MSALNIKKGSSSHSAYDLRDSHSEVEESHTLAVIVENEPGVLARVIGLFSGRGYNIDSLTVAEVDHTGHRSRITVVTRGTPAVIDQIEAQLSRMVPVHAVHDLTAKGQASSANWRCSRWPARAITGSRRCVWPRSSAPMWWTARWSRSSSR